jgi:hypothetical protein
MALPLMSPLLLPVQKGRWVLCLGLVLLAGKVAATGGCRVIDPELQSAYRGACNAEGYAEGLGVAKGISEYTGNFRAGRKHGRGSKTWPSGDSYVGEFVDDTKQGQGIYIWGAGSPNAGDSYQGRYRADQRHGHGIYQWASGERYEGPWADDLMTGPPTGMAIQRGRHQAAVREAVMKPGIIVCRRLGDNEKIDRIRGIVEGADLARMTISVRAEGIPDRGLIDSAMAWEPCL